MLLEGEWDKCACTGFRDHHPIACAAQSSVYDSGKMQSCFGGKERDSHELHICR